MRQVMLVWGLAQVCTYAICAFTAWEWNPALWDGFLRFTGAGLPAYMALCKFWLRNA